jgi:hypothetical protein
MLVRLDHSLNEALVASNQRVNRLFQTLRNDECGQDTYPGDFRGCGSASAFQQTALGRRELKLFDDRCLGNWRWTRHAALRWSDGIGTNLRWSKQKEKGMAKRRRQE